MLLCTLWINLVRCMSPIVDENRFTFTIYTAPSPPPPFFFIRVLFQKQSDVWREQWAMFILHVSCVFLVKGHQSMPCSASPGVIRCGWLDSKYQLTNYNVARGAGDKRGPVQSLSDSLLPKVGYGRPAESSVKVNVKSFCLSTERGRSP